MENLKNKRNKLGYSQEQVAREAGISLQHYCLIETGRVSNVTKETMISISKALKSNVVDLFFPEEKKVKEVA